jgi:hypothetical protein
MARPIKETPVLRGKEAVKFHNQLFQNRNRKATSEEFAAIQKDFDFIKAMSSRST